MFNFFSFQKYYPPNFVPNEVPRIRQQKKRQYTVRVMMPFNIKCNTCGDYIAKAKKFNAKKETCENEEYIGLKIFRFYFKCPVCMAEITLKTDPKNSEYELEHGATRNFQALRLSEQKAIQEAKDKEEEHRSNPIKLLEERTQNSRREMEEMEELEELKDLSDKKTVVNFEKLIADKKEETKAAAKRQKEKEEEEDEALFKSIMAEKAAMSKSSTVPSTAKFTTSFFRNLPKQSKRKEKKRKLAKLIRIKETDQLVNKKSY